MKNHNVLYPQLKGIRLRIYFVSYYKNTEMRLKNFLFKTLPYACNLACLGVEYTRNIMTINSLINGGKNERIQILHTY